MDPDKQIIALYARGASYGDIRDHLMDIYGLEASVATITRVTDKILPFPLYPLFQDQSTNCLTASRGIVGRMGEYTVKPQPPSVKKKTRILLYGSGFVAGAGLEPTTFGL